MGIAYRLKQAPGKWNRAELRRRQSFWFDKWLLLPLLKKRNLFLCLRSGEITFFRVIWFINRGPHRKLLLGMPSFKHRLTTDSIFKPILLLENRRSTQSKRRDSPSNNYVVCVGGIEFQIIRWQKGTPLNLESILSFPKGSKVQWSLTQIQRKDWEST